MSQNFQSKCHKHWFLSPHSVTSMFSACCVFLFLSFWCASVIALSEDWLAGRLGSLWRGCDYHISRWVCWWQKKLPHLHLCPSPCSPSAHTIAPYLPWATVPHWLSHTELLVVGPTPCWLRPRWGQWEEDLCLVVCARVECFEKGLCFWGSATDYTPMWPPREESCLVCLVDTALQKEETDWNQDIVFSSCTNDGRLKEAVVVFEKSRTTKIEVGGTGKFQLFKTSNLHFVWILWNPSALLD